MLNNLLPRAYGLTEDIVYRAVECVCECVLLVVRLSLFERDEWSYAGHLVVFEVKTEHFVKKLT